MSQSFYEQSAVDIQGNAVSMSDYKGKVVLVVNTASECGFTHQYKPLEHLYQLYKDQGFVVLGFPCNQFGGQEKGDEATISQFCELNFGVSFPLFSKVDVNGTEAAPLYKFLKSSAKGLLGSESIKWNFTKFLINKDGKVLKRYSPTIKPENLMTEIETLLK
ncbi:glutathione peroxidase [Shewanella electrodiphila]|uniref:Glutathione peroxidase n=1 Tax=Shewanella electrodiphila TaxID=934143 RepID=A0ABT0KMR7_9GAMM|nr:glutathione peroxidase [Shewanella electrodiphila]MCL1044894.1 glutathione peroxidase [Shewanella electrodiphila]